MAKKSNVSTVRDLLDDAADDLMNDLKQADDEALGYAVVKPSGDFASYLYVDQIPEMVKYHAMMPQLQGHTLCFLGSSAIGKTYGVRQGIAEAAAAMGRESVLHEMHVSQMGPTDIMGVPRDDGKGRTEWFVPAKFALQSALPDHQAAFEQFQTHYNLTGHTDWSLLRDHKHYTYFWDEVTNPSMPSIAHQAFSLWYGNYVADHKLVGDAMHILAGNRVQDGTNSIYLARSATSRLAMIETLPRLSGWMRSWALKTELVGDEEFTRVHPLVIAYLHRWSDQFAPDTTGLGQMEPYCSPRTWTYVSDILYANDKLPMDEAQLFSLVSGRIGVNAARQFWAFRDHWKDLPNVNKMMNSEAKPGSPFGWLPEQWPTRPDVLMIIGTQMVTKLNASNAKRFMAFMLDTEKFPPEIAAMTMKLLRPANKIDSLVGSWARAEFRQWSALYRSLLF